MNDSIRMTWPMYRRGTCFYHGRRVRLGRVCIDILSTLLLNRGRSVTYSEMIEAVYPDPDFEPDFAADCINHALATLREKLPGLVITRRGSGWGWIIDRPCEDDLRKAA